MHGEINNQLSNLLALFHQPLVWYSLMHQHRTVSSRCLTIPSCHTHLHNTTPNPGHSTTDTDSALGGNTFCSPKAAPALCTDAQNITVYIQQEYIITAPVLEYHQWTTIRRALFVCINQDIICYACYSLLSINVLIGNLFIPLEAWGAKGLGRQPNIL